MSVALPIEGAESLIEQMGGPGALAGGADDGSLGGVTDGLAWLLGCLVCARCRF